jgi:hypothetical protein
MGRRLARDWYVAMADEALRVVESITCRVSPEVMSKFDLWVPRRSIMRLVDGEWVGVVEEMLPGYVLVHCDGADPSTIETVLGLPLVRFGKKPQCLSPEDIRRIEGCTEKVLYEIGESLEPGDAVRVRQDARSSFAGMSGALLDVMMYETGVRARVRLRVSEEREATQVLPYDHLERRTPAGG